MNTVAVVAALSLPVGAMAQEIPASAVKAALLESMKTYMLRSPYRNYVVPVDVDQYLVVKMVAAKPARFDNVRTQDQIEGVPNCTSGPIIASSAISVTDTQSATVSVSETTTIGMSEKVSASVDGIGTELSASLSEAVTVGASSTSSTARTRTITSQVPNLLANTGVKFVPVQNTAIYDNARYDMWIKPLHGHYQPPMSPIVFGQDFEAFYNIADDVNYPPLHVVGAFTGKESTGILVVTVNMDAAEVQQLCMSPNMPQGTRTAPRPGGMIVHLPASRGPNDPLGPGRVIDPGMIRH